MEDESHRRRHLEPELPGAHDESGVRVADARGEFPERPRRAGMTIRPEKDFAGAGMALLRQGDETHRAWSKHPVRNRSRSLNRNRSLE